MRAITSIALLICVAAVVCGAAPSPDAPAAVKEPTDGIRGSEGSDLTPAESAHGYGGYGRGWGGYGRGGYGGWGGGYGGWGGGYRRGGYGWGGGYGRGGYGWGGGYGRGGGYGWGR